MKLWATSLFLRKGASLFSSWNQWVGIWSWNPAIETVKDLQKRVNSSKNAKGILRRWSYDVNFSGESYYYICDKEVQSQLDLPVIFNVQNLYKNTNVLIFDISGNLIFDKNHHELKLSKRPSLPPDLGKWLGNASKYSVGKNGETNGPNGLSFL